MGTSCFGFRVHCSVTLVLAHIRFPPLLKGSVNTDGYGWSGRPLFCCEPSPLETKTCYSIKPSQGGL
uniref:Uncharacterized protein n=1 Tax=Anguilla anguilla TaxID=7936 RepID=A0A0E9VZU9_ANGAN